MKKFDTAVQYLKYKVYREVARHAFKDDLENSINEKNNLSNREEAISSFFSKHK